MSETETFECDVRDAIGKGASRAARRGGRIPAVVYGGDEAPVSITLDYNEIQKAYFSGQLTGRLATLSIAGKAQPVLPRDVQVDRVRDTPIHVDFIRVDERTRIDVAVAVRFLNEDTSPGLKKGGVLNVVRHEVELKCPATRIPEFIELDLAAAEIGDTLHMSAITLPDGVTPTITDRDFTVATIVAPRTAKADDEGEDAAETEAESEE